MDRHRYPALIDLQSTFIQIEVNADHVFLGGWSVG